MRLDLRDIINIPGAGVTFKYEPDLADAESSSVIGVRNTAAEGSVRNNAGVLHFTADIHAVMDCICARCLKEFEYPVNQHVTAILTEQEQDEDDQDRFVLQGDFVEVDDIVTTEFVLNIDQRLLCREDCKGLCENCGADLNAGPCTCKKATDPRLAALGKLLESD